MCLSDSKDARKSRRIGSACFLIAWALKLFLHTAGEPARTFLLFVVSLLLGASILFNLRAVRMRRNGS